MVLSLENNRKWYANEGYIELREQDGIVYISSMAKGDKFTVGMLRDIIRLSKQYKIICLIVDTVSKQEQIRSVLSKRWDMDYHMVDDMLFAFYDKG